LSGAEEEDEGEEGEKNISIEQEQLDRRYYNAVIPAEELLERDYYYADSDRDIGSSRYGSRHPLMDNISERSPPDTSMGYNNSITMTMELPSGLHPGADHNMSTTTSSLIAPSQQQRRRLRLKERTKDPTALDFQPDVMTRSVYLRLLQYSKAYYALSKEQRKVLDEIDQQLR
jgi:hypothetical protein